MFASTTLEQPIAAYSRPVEPYMLTGTTPANNDQSWRKWTCVIRSLLGLEFLQDDWDGQGASSPPLPVVWRAIRVAENLQKVGQTPPVTAVATPAGTILFTWGDQSIYFEAEIVSPDRLEWMEKEQGKPATHGEIRFPVSAESVDWF
jgi:hypothetical protein